VSQALASTVGRIASVVLLFLLIISTCICIKKCHQKYLRLRSNRRDANASHDCDDAKVTAITLSQDASPKSLKQNTSFYEYCANRQRSMSEPSALHDSIVALAIHSPMKSAWHSLNNSKSGNNSNESYTDIEDDDDEDQDEKDSPLTTPKQQRAPSRTDSKRREFEESAQGFLIMETESSSKLIESEPIKQIVKEMEDIIDGIDDEDIDGVNQHDVEEEKHVQNDIQGKLRRASVDTLPESTRAEITRLMLGPEVRFVDDESASCFSRQSTNLSCSTNTSQYHAFMKPIDEKTKNKVAMQMEAKEQDQKEVDHEDEDGTEEEDISSLSSAECTTTKTMTYENSIDDYNLLRGIKTVHPDRTASMSVQTEEVLDGDTRRMSASTSVSEKEWEHNVLREMSRMNEKIVIPDIDLKLKINEYKGSIRKSEESSLSGKDRRESVDKLAEQQVVTSKRSIFEANTNSSSRR